MRRVSWLWMAAAGAAVCLASAGVLAQDGEKADVERLRQQLRDLQAKLLEMEDSAGSTRVTQIGGSRPRGREPELVVRIYDLSDLFTMAPPYEAKFSSDLKEEDKPVFPRPSVDRASGPGGMGGMGGGMGGMGGGFFSVPDPKPTTVVPDASKNVLFQNANVNIGAGRSSINDLIKTITSTISPSDWEEAGGPASISSLGTSMIVSAEEQTHAQIDALLNLFRKRWGTLRTVSVRAYWLCLSDAELTGLLAEGQAARDRTGELPAYGLVNPQAWQKHLEGLAQALDRRRAGYRAVVTCYNGQTVYAISGGQSLAVTQVQPVPVKGDEKTPATVAYRPEVSVIHEGAAIQVTPISSNTGKFVVIDVHSRVVESRPAKAAAKEAKPGAMMPGGPGGGLGGMPMGGVAMGGMEGMALGASGMALAPPPGNVVAAIDRPELVSQRFSTTLRVPVDQPMLVGGMSFEGSRGPGEEPLYLFLKVSVQELRDDAASQKPLEVPAEMAPSAKEKPPAAKPKAEPAPKPHPRPEAKPEKKKP